MKRPGETKTEGVKIRPRIIAAIPAYNEEKYIGTIVLQTRQYVDEVIVLDDGSTDRTAETASLAGADVIRHAANMGKGAALQSLMQEVKNRDADVLVFLDADAQHNPAEIPELVKPVLAGYDLIIGARQTHKQSTPLYRRFGRRLLLLTSNVLSGTRLTDSESGFRAISRKGISQINLTEKGFAVETEMIARASEKGLKIIEVPVSNIYTGDGSTLNPWVHGVGVLGRIISLVSERRPLFFFGVLGALITLASLLIGYWVVQTSLLGGGLQMGSALLAAILFICGLFSIFTAIILNALKRLRP
jgi:glycosyltransferase involved in cell wall biosynthesis